MHKNPHLDLIVIKINNEPLNKSETLPGPNKNSVLPLDS